MENTQRNAELPVSMGLIGNDSDEMIPDRSKPSFVVGVGASAGGLEALELFFASVHEDTSLAFVVVQHLSPNFKTMMDELLARQTGLTIHLAEQDMAVQAGCIYLLPPRKQMIIAEGRLLVTDKDPTEDFFLPIDHFFRSLGQDQCGKSIAIILSGTGGDGSRGIQHIHRAGGLVLAQSEESAAFDGMTRNAQSTGMVDLVLSPEDMPEALQRYAHNPATWRSAHEHEIDNNESGGSVASIIKLLRHEFGIDFSHYKTDMIERRLERRLLIDDSESIDAYAEKLERDDGELSTLYRDMLIGVTGFFRDTEAYERLEKRLLPALMNRLQPNEEFRIWVAATATGEEAYSIAILVDEYFTSRNLPVRCRIFATDVHQASLDFAGKGLYSERSVRGLSPERLKCYFRKEAAGYRVTAEIRRLVVFAPHNVITDAPFTKLNLVTCRNLFIYLKPEVQRRVLTLFHFGLLVGGGLWLGSGEVPAELSDEFEPIDSQWKLYTKLRDVRLTSRVRLPQSAPQLRNREGTRIASSGKDDGLLSTYDRLLECYMPMAMLLTEERNLLQCFSGASRFIRPSDGRVSDDIADQLDPALRVPLRTVIQKAKRDGKVVDYGGINYASESGPRTLHLIARPVERPDEKTNYFLVEFKLDESEDGSESTPEQLDAELASSEHVDALERELNFARQSLNATIEELQAANEEMQSTNEQLVASNEELQSTNEELHSVNEELYTVNAEYQRKIAELTELTDDMDNLLNSTHVDTIFLDRELKVRKFTPDVAEKFNLLRQDIGRHFESFTYRLDDSELIDELRQVLITELPFEREVRDRKSHVYLMRILPYVSRGKVEGVVLTLVDITSLKQAQTRLAELSEIVQQSADAIFRVDCDGVIRTWNDGAKKLYRRDESIVGTTLTELLPESLHEQLHEIIGQLTAQYREVELATHELNIDGRVVYISASISPVRDDSGELVASSVVARDITDRVVAETEIRQSVERRDQFLAMLSHELRNPLGAIVNAARVIQSAADDPRMLENASRIVIRQSSQMSQLLDDLLDVSRITLGKIELKRKVFDLGDTISEAVQVIGSAFSQANIEFQYDSCDQTLFVNGDPVRLQQVVVNLLRNAVKYTPAGGTVRLIVLQNRGEVEIRVRDSGVGLDSDAIDTIFEMFVQVNGSLERSQGGIGLGLTLVQAVTEMHGGSVEAFSEGLGLGSEFRVRLPLTEEPPIVEIKPKLRNTIKRVGIVEDIPDAREMLQGLLELQGFEVCTAGNGKSGLEMVHQEQPDLSLIDIGLPEIDGYEVARRLRSDPSTEKLLLVALTGYGQESDRELVRQAGFDDHLVKPLSLDELNSLLTRYSTM